MRAVTACALAALASVPRLAAGQTCNTQGVHIISARGTLEAQGEGMDSIIINQVMADIPGSDAVSLVYPADFDIPYSPNTGVANMLTEVTQYAQACPDSKMVLIGYSQGAQIIACAVSGGGVDTLMHQGFINNTPPLSADIMSKVTAMVLFGDVNFIANQPYDQDGCTSDSTVVRTGVLATTLNSYAAKLQSWCAPGDPICCGTGTDQAAHESYFTPEIASSAASFVQSLYNAGGSSGAGSSTNQSTTSTTQSSTSTSQSTSSASSSGSSSSSSSHASSSTIASSSLTSSSATPSTTPSKTTTLSTSSTTTTPSSSSSTSKASSSTSTSKVLGLLSLCCLLHLLL